MMAGEDLSVIFDGKRPPPRPHFTSCYDDYVLAGDDDWFFISDSEGLRKRLYDKKNDPTGAHDVARRAPRRSSTSTGASSSDEAGGTLPQFSRHGAQAGARRMSLTRRTLLRRGGATAAGAGVLGSLAARGAGGRRSSATTARAARCSSCCRSCAPTT